MQPILRAPTVPEVTEQERAHYRLARQAAAEGIVMLKNDGTLPLKPGRIALFGLGARHPFYWGVGSGECHPRYTVSPEEGLKNAGFQIETERWLFNMDADYKTSFDRWNHTFLRGISKERSRDQFQYSTQHPFLPPAGPPITESDVASCGTDTAVYVLTHPAGEGKDRSLERGDWKLAERELEHLKFLTDHFDHVVLVLNTCGLMDLTELEGLGVNAILYALEGGMEAGNAIADVLTGAVAPCGHLTDTWGRSYEDYPGAAHFAGLDGDPMHEVYEEGFFVGYRWFDSMHKKPLYPFGYGLTYTEFTMESRSIEVFGDHVVVDVYVCNVGDTFAGRAVPQLYLTAPDGELEKERKSLAAFGKTGILNPGEGQSVRLEFDLRNFASYDEQHACYVLEGGNYLLQLGEHAGALRPVGTLFLDEDTVTEVCENVCTPIAPVPQTKMPSYVPLAPVEPIIPIKGHSIYQEIHRYRTPGFQHDAKTDFVLEHMDLAQMTALTVGTSYVGQIHNMVIGAAGYTTSEFIELGLENLTFCDGPQGINVIPASAKPLSNRFSMPVMPANMRFGLKYAAEVIGRPRKKERRTIYYQYCTALPCGMVLAQTWDTELAEKVGKAVGEEMRRLGIAFWLAPGMNIHRNPLCGRSNEYYSEDPLLTGKMAAAVTEGVQSNKGCFVTLKHFACNNQETERTLVDARIGERALREIYLKGFRMAVKAGARGVMCSYNRINGVWSANNYDLCTKILRNEWNFTGLVMTDWYGSGHDGVRDDRCAMAGCDLIMPGDTCILGRLLRGMESGEVDKNAVKRSAWNVAKASVDSCISSELFRRERGM